MLPLRRVLIDHDLGMLRAIAGLWGVELSAGDSRAAAEELAARLLQPDAVQEVIETLLPGARLALDDLVAAGGALPVAQAARRHGDIRPMGPARRDREQPWLDPASPLEALWYRGLIGRAFAEARPSPQEFIFIPADLLPLLPQAEPATSALPGHSAPEPETFRAAGAGLAEDACTLLAYLQNEEIERPSPEASGRFQPESTLLAERRQRLPLIPFLQLPGAVDLALHLVRRLGLAETSGRWLKPDPARARPFLQAPLADQHLRLAEAWQTDPTWNDLAYAVAQTGLEWAWPNGAAPNDPLGARQAVLALLARIPSGEWWSLESFVQAVKEQTPDFQRPAGDYDSWYIQDPATGDYLRGFEQWERVDGALVWYLICGPLHWLGLADMASGQDDSGVGAAAFRLTWAARALIHGQPWPAAPPEALLRIEADGSLVVPAAVKPYDRFTAARFTDWERLEAGRPEGPVYRYCLSAGSLARAKAQGVAVRHVLAFLGKAAANPLPRSLVEALERWEREGAEAVIGETAVLRLKSPELLERLRKLPKTRSLLGEALGPTAVEVRPGNIDKLRAALAEIGLLADIL